MSLQQQETLTVVEFAVKIDDLVAELKAIKGSEEFGEYVGDGVAVIETAAPPARSVCSSLLYSVAYAWNTVVPRFASE